MAWVFTATRYTLFWVERCTETKWLATTTTIFTKPITTTPQTNNNNNNNNHHKNLFDSTDFTNFLGNYDFGDKNAPFLSKDTSLPDSSSKVFQSAEFFSNLFQDWESKTSIEDVKATAQELLKNNSLMVKKDDDEDFASLKDTWKSEEWAPRTLDLSQASVSPSIFDDEDKKVEEEELRNS